MARPTKLTKEIIERAKTYIEDCEDTTEQEVIGTSAKGTELYKNKVKVSLPTVEGMAYYLGINRDTIYAWCKENDEFSDIIDSLRAKQAKELINKGLSGDYNPTIAKVLLGKHGYSEKQEIDHTTKGESLNESEVDLEEIVKEVEEKLKEKKT